MKDELNEQILLQENECFSNATGMSENIRCRGLHPAFRNDVTGDVYLSRFANGQLAPVHLPSCLPDDIVTRRAGTGEVSAVSTSVVTGFVFAGHFYTRAEVIELSETRH